MDDPVAIALILSGSSAVVALALIGRRMLKEREQRAPGVGEDVFASHVNAEPAAAVADPAAEAPVVEAPTGSPAPTDDVFAARINSDASAPAAIAEEPAPAEPRTPTVAGSDVFDARISEDATSAPAAPRPRVATPADADVFASHMSAPVEEPAVEEPVAGIDDAEAVPEPESESTEESPAAPAGDVFADRIDPAAAVEETRAPEADDEPVAEPEPAAPAVAGADVFDARISAAAAPSPVDQGASDPFGRFIGSDEPAEITSPENSIYPEDTCRAFAQGLKDDVLDRALTLFWALAREGSIDSNDLGALLGARSRQAGALVSTPMKRRSEEMDLPLPYVIGRSSPSRLRTWSDQFGIAERMAAALLDEQQARDTTTDDDPDGFSGLTSWLAQQSDAVVTMSLEEIDALGPVPLPEHAASQRNWWANRSGGPGHGHAEAWLSAGRLAYPDLKAGSVVFELLPGLQDAEPSEAETAPDEAELTR